MAVSRVWRGGKIRNVEIRIIIKWGIFYCNLSMLQSGEKE